MITFEDIKKDETVKIYIQKADESLTALGFTEHSFAHVTKVALTAADILKKTGHCNEDIELAKIAGFMHDIGNLVNRVEHSQSGAVMAFRILKDIGMPPEDIATVVTAIGNHDEGTGVAVNDVAAALILADKTDVRRSRVRNRDVSTFDIHDRVNYSVKESSLAVDAENKYIILSLTIDTEISSVMNYFEIFLTRMLMCQKAAEKLGLVFGLSINGQKLL
ncbi:MAG: HD domain-containing protein [Ruminococcaceae bacterium]|nr:HD domain-containing protein [Oscillospiraceae bacterium]